MEMINQGSNCDGENSLRVPAPLSSSSRSRQTFYIELRPGETTIISWKKLLRDANNSHPTTAVEDSLISEEKSLEAQFALKGCFQDDQSVTNENGFHVDGGRTKQKNESFSPANCEFKKKRKNRTRDLEGTIGGHVAQKLAKLNERRNATSKNLSFLKQSSSIEPDVDGNSEHHTGGDLKHSLSSAIVFLEKKKADTSSKFERSSYSGTSDLDVSVFSVPPIEINKHKSGTAQSRSLGNIVRDQSGFHSTTHQTSQDENTSRKIDSREKRVLNEANEQHFSKKLQRNKKVSKRIPDLNIPAFPVQSATSPPMDSQEVSSLRPRVYLLERAIKELEKYVVEVRPPISEVQDDNTSIPMKRRLPPEVKQRLGKVARLAHSTEGKVSKDLMNRLMGILGHLVQLRTVKRNLQEMIILGLTAKREKADRFQQIKKEVAELIKLQAVEQRDGSTNVYQQAHGSDDKGANEEKYRIDNSVEDRISDLYDLYIQGMDEDKTSQSRKFYAEVAELWPNGVMDSNGIRHAICRAKERRKAFYSKEKVREMDKRKKLSKLKTEDGQLKARASVQPQAKRERIISESNSHVLALPTNMVSTIATGEHHISKHVRMSSPFSKGLNTDLPKQEKLAFPMLKEHTKQEQKDVEGRWNKLSLKSQKESHKSDKQATGSLDDFGLQVASPPSCERPG